MAENDSPYASGRQVVPTGPANSNLEVTTEREFSDWKRRARVVAATVPIMVVAASGAQALANPIFEEPETPSSEVNLSGKVQEAYSTVAVSGQVMEIFPRKEGKPLEGYKRSKVYLINQNGEVVDSSKVTKKPKSSRGTFEFADVEPGLYDLLMEVKFKNRKNRQWHYDRRFSVEISGDGIINLFDPVSALDYRIDGSTFNNTDFLEYFDLLARRNEFELKGDGAKYKDGTIRWIERPTFYLDMKSLRRLPQNLDWLLGEIYKSINIHLPHVYGDFWNNAEIIEVENRSDLPEEGTEGAYIVRGGEADGGAAIHQVWVNNNIKRSVNGRNITYDNATTSAYVEISREAGGSNIAQDILNAAGLWADHGSGKDSIFRNINHALEPTGLDVRLGHLLYSVQPGMRIVYETDDSGNKRLNEDGEVTNATIDTSHLSPVIGQLVTSSAASGNAYQGNSNSGNK